MPIKKLAFSVFASFQILLATISPVCGAGVTIVTHGFQATRAVEDPAWLYSMAYELAFRAGNVNSEVSIYRAVVESVNFQIKVSRFEKIVGPSPKDALKSEIIILLNWRELAAAQSAVSTRYVASALFPILTNSALSSDLGGPLCEMPLHLIGHSRGGSLLCELSRLLGQQGIWVDQITTLDPHPWTVPIPPDSGLAAYDNVRFLDNYFRTGAYPSGYPIPGGTNLDLSAVITGDGLSCMEHEEIHSYYHGSVDIGAATVDGCAIRSEWFMSPFPAKAKTGFYFSRIGRGNRPVEGLKIAGAPRVAISNPVPDAEAWDNIEITGHTEDLSLSQGAYLGIQFYFEDRNRDATITLGYDTDQNPYNGGMTTLNSFGTGGINGDFYQQIFDTASIPVGTYYLFAKIRNGTHTRYYYAPGKLTINQTISSTITVTTTSDSGAGSLRQVILDANSRTGLTRINFNIPGNGVHTIMPISQLPEILVPVIIDGYTQPGASPNTLSVGNNANLKIELNGSIAANYSFGLRLRGGNSIIRGVAINGFPNNGIDIRSKGGNTIEGNFIGTDVSGEVGSNNFNGVTIFTSDNVVGGVSPFSRNIISGNRSVGVYLWESARNRISGNYIGTDASGTRALTNTLMGIIISGIGSSNNIVGGSSINTGNLISGIESGGHGVWILFGAANRVSGNLIGTDATGIKKIGNDGAGIQIEGSSKNIIGGLNTGARNVISGNRWGINMGNRSYNGTEYPGDDNVILGNFIGTDATGTIALGNSATGINLGGKNNTVGGTDQGAGNLISGNGASLSSCCSHGIEIYSSDFNRILGNKIGTDISGNYALANGGIGVFLNQSSNNIIGGNLISGNGEHGIEIYSSDFNGIFGNKIGTDISGNIPLANKVFGIMVGDSRNNIVGRTNLGAGNVIMTGSFYAAVYVILEATTNNSIRGNSLFSHIALQVGGNHYQKAPELKLALSETNTLVIWGALQDRTNNNYALDFFASSGPYQGQRYLGSCDVVTDSQGHFDFQVSFPTTIPSDYVLTSTATDSSGNTSEFSSGIKLSVKPVITESPENQVVVKGTNVSFNVTATGSSPLRYQWSLNGTNLPSATRASLSIANVSGLDAGSYRVIVTNVAGSATGEVATLTVLLPPTFLVQPTNSVQVVGTTAFFRAVTAGTEPLSFQWNKNGSPLADNENISGATGSQLTLSEISSGDTATYDVIVTNIAGSVTSSPATLTVVIPPEILVQPQSRTNNAGTTATFSVVSSGNLLAYQWRKNGAAISDGGNTSGASGSALSLAPVSANHGATYDVVITNVAGSVTSAPAVLTVVIPPTIVTQPQSQTTNAGATIAFNVVASGNFLTYQWRKGATALVDGGKISGARTATLTLANVLFSDSGSYNVVVTNSAGNATSDTATLTVDVRFPKDVYNGLFYDTNGVRHESSGFFTAKTTTKGAFSAKIEVAGKKHSSAGSLDLDGKATNTIARAGLNPLSIELALDFSGKDQITGRVTDGIWSADLTADKALFNAVTNPAPQAGRYTMHIPGNPDPAESPGGDGFGTVTVNAFGKISLKGTLGDGTKVSQKTSLSKNGEWPFYAMAYKGSGSVLSWVTFTNGSPKVFGGDLSWIKKTSAPAKFYAAGFTNDTMALGSFYTPPLPGNRVLNFGISTVRFTGGNLSQSFRNNVVLGADNKVTNLDSNKLTLTITLPTGLFKGKATYPASGETISFKGAVSQKENAGFGFFLGTNQSGLAYFGE